MKWKDRFQYSDFHRVYNLKTNEGIGASMILTNASMGNIANAVITGALQTAFLVANGIDIVRVGIISFIPYISWALSMFSPMIMARFKKRRGILLVNHLVYNVCVVLATTVMPLFAEGAAAKTAWFAVFLFIGNASNAIFGSGLTAWQLHFIPRGRDRNVYLSINNTCCIVLSTVSSIAAALLADTLSGGDQARILFILRIVAFVVLMVGGFLVLCVPKEYPYPESGQKLRLRDVFTQPPKYRPFLLTVMFCFFLNIGAYFNNSTWGVYLLDTLKFPLWYTYVGSLVNALGCIFLSKLMRRFIDKVTVFRAVGIFLSIFMILEFANTFVTKETAPLFFAINILSGTVCVGYNIAYSNLFYINLPDEGNKDLFTVFWNMTINVAAFLGGAIGTWILSLFERHGVYHLMGMDFYGSQFLSTIKGLWYAGMIVFLFKSLNVLQSGRRN